jgi:hypothetical protein
VIAKWGLVDLKGVAVDGAQKGVELFGTPNDVGLHILIVHLGQVLGLPQNHVHLGVIGALVTGAAAI